MNPKKLLKKGKYKEDNYRGFEGEEYQINCFTKCGHCVQCQNEKANNWIVRNYYESKCHEKKCFITLTYAENPYIIVRSDMQKFLKRLRIYFDRHEKGTKIRMFYCMEYGEMKHRPHGHVIIYGWEDKNAQYLTINKKTNIVYQSNIIQKIWGLGRTSYQTFSDFEAPYISLYNTPKEGFKKDYIITREKLKKLEELYRRNKDFDNDRRKELSKNLQEIRKEMEKNKAKYTVLREINGWSLALGWEKFFEEYSKSEKYVFMEYIYDKQYPTPTPWVKKLANMGDIQAAEEMFRREREIEQSFTEAEERAKAICKENAKRKNELLEWIDKRNKIEIDI